ncbi:MAG: NAD(P)/FAD-dependent oxidoreductase [Candidatus Rokubacteria bacterium]|nr:NAD(P)/FAD-dependent oxidoreductase [Candidatus Rokubacteria bacterium]
MDDRVQDDAVERSPSRYDAIIVGAGHNGLVTAGYLARAGRRVLVLERRPVVGGACVTEETFPGFKVSTAAYVNSLFRKEIVDDLKLRDYGYAVLPRDPSSFTPFLDGRSLLMGPDAALTHREIAKFSARDAERYPRYEAMLERAAAFVEPTLTMTPPDLFRPRLRDLKTLLTLARGFRRLGTAAASETIEIMTGAARTILDRWFESEELKATLATDAIIGAMASPSMPGTAYVLFHHVMGETDGKRGVWGYVRGGMGGLTQALAASARDRGAVIRCEADVARILVRDGRATGVALRTGEEFHAPIVASNADARVTYLGLLDRRELPADLVEAVERISYDSASLKINVALAELPDFTAVPGVRAAPHHRGTIHICPDQDYIERAYDDAKYGRTSAAPVLECTIPSVVDPSVAPPGQHLMSMFVQYAPYHLRSGSWDTERDAFADRCFDLLNDYAPNFKRSVIARQVLAPPDLERVFGLTGGNIFQGAMTLGQLFAFRPALGYTGYRTPIRGLYVCGSAAHPGGGVMGIPGLNAAREILGRV